MKNESQVFTDVQGQIDAEALSAPATPAKRNGAAAKTTKNEEQVELHEVNLRTMTVPIRGITGLISHRFSEENQKQIEDKQQKKAPRAKGARDPEAEYRAGCYLINEDPEDFSRSAFGFPAIAFKNAIVGACRFVDNLPMTRAAGAFHVLGDLLPLDGPAPQQRADRVVIGRGTTSIAYRPEFVEWSTTLRIRYNADYISMTQLLNLIELAGFSVGVGDWRPEKKGNHGMFEVDRDGVIVGSK